MVAPFVYHRLTAAPRRSREVARRIALESGPRLASRGGTLYGLWGSQIGRPRDELHAITVWARPVRASDAEDLLLGEDEIDVFTQRSELLLPTFRPSDTLPPTRQGNYAFRWFATPEADWPEFLDLCVEGWPGFEAVEDSQIVGLWQAIGDRTGEGPDEATGAGVHLGVRSLMVSRRGSLAMWERAALRPDPASGETEREILRRRYDLCDWTVVSTATLLTSTDRNGKASG